MKQKVSFLCIVFILSTILGSPIYAQQGFRIGDEMKTPSTDTWNFIKQGDIGANLHTGTVNLSIPVYTYKDNDFEIPITLDYSSNGLICNMRAGILGPDWVLNAGGSISIEINGMQDFSGTEYAASFYEYHLAENPSRNGSYWRYTNLASQSVTVGALSPEIIYVPDSSKTIVNITDKYDAEPDIFHFNFMGYSGSFHLGRDRAIHVYNTNCENKLLNISISKENNSINIIFTDKYGYKYLFQKDNSDKAPNHEGELKLAVAYKLSSITAPNGRCMEFEYATADMTTYRPASFYYTGAILDFRYDNVEEAVNNTLSDIRTLESQSEGAIVSRVCVDSKTVASFIYTSFPSGKGDQYQIDDMGTLREFDDCKRLKQIVILNPAVNGDTLKTVEFSYTPTGGARINYMTSLSISGEGEYTFDYHNIKYGSFPPIGTRKIDHWGYYNNRSGDKFLKIVTTNPATLEESINTNVRDPQALYAKYGMLEKITYPTGGYSVLEYEGHDYRHAMRRYASNAFHLKLIEENGICGGLRIKSVTNYTADNTVVNSRTYSYTKDGYSSGILLHFPKYWLNYSAWPEINFAEYNINFWSNSLFHHNGTHIEYEMVTQTDSDGSKEVFHYSNSRLSRWYRDETIGSETVPERMPGCGIWQLSSNKVLIANITMPVVSRNVERGKLLKHEVFRNDALLPDRTTIFQYDTSSADITFDSYPIYLVRQFGKASICTDNYKLINTTTIERFLNDSLITNSENIQYNAYYQPSQIITKMSNGNTKITRYEYASDYKNAGGIYATMNERHLLSYPVTERVYLEDKMGIETLISGIRYTYGLFNNIVKVSKEESYNPHTCQWETTTTYTNYDNQGNLLESRDANGVPTSYIWGYNGLYMVGKIENMYRNSINSTISTSPLSGCLSPAQISSIKTAAPDALVSIYEYEPMVGLSKVVQPSGEVLTYRYNSTGKLMGIYNTKGEKVEENLYSPDNKQ